MNALLAAVRWRRSRWAACAALIPVLWACNDRKLAAPVSGPTQVINNRFVQSVNRDLDLLFMIDTSSSMSPLQTKLQARLPDFIDFLKTKIDGGLPDLHIAVVSSSLGAGKFSGVPGCDHAPPGDDNGGFIHLPACTALNPGSTFITANADGTKNNFTGDLTALFSCMALIGDRGCGFESQLRSPMVALQRSQIANDPNYGFLRDDAFFALIMLTNEDDSSVPDDSELFNPGVITVNDPSGLGGLQSYRSNEFGHLCDGKKIPHLPPPAPVTLTNCVSDEDPDATYSDRLHEIRVKDFIDFFKGLKPEQPEKVLMAAIAGPSTPYIVDSKMFTLTNQTMELQPFVAHSCTQSSGEYADPAVRIRQFLDGFGSNAVFETICATDFGRAMTAIATAIGKRIGAQCINNRVATNSATGLPDCVVSERGSTTSGSAAKEVGIPACNAATSNFPCWRLDTDANCPMGKHGTICRDAACDPNNRPRDPRSALFACTVEQ